jgi:tRNA-binding protein
MSEPPAPPPLPQTSVDDFARLDIRVGRIVSAAPLARARVPAYELEIDFGRLGVKRSSARITRRYAAESLVGRLVVAVVNFPPRQIASVRSEVLVLGACPEADDVVLLAPDAEVEPGTRIA